MNNLIMYLNMLGFQLPKCHHVNRYVYNFWLPSSISPFLPKLITKLIDLIMETSGIGLPKCTRVV